MANRPRSLSRLCGIVLALTAGAACAHAFPDHSRPGAGARLNKAPAEVRIWFDADLEPAFTQIKVENAQGQVVSRNSHVDKNNPRLLEADLPSLAPGRYQVHWIAVATDSHRTVGDYRFTIGP